MIADTLQKLGIRFFGGINSPYIWFECPNGMDSWTCFDFLLTKIQVVGTPGAGFGENGKNFFRLTSFGNYEKNGEDLYNPFTYCGEYFLNEECFDDELGWIYLRSRFYEPNSGRFITEDPARYGMNWYAYCGNNPIMFKDPFGMEKIVVSGGVYSNEKKSKGKFYYEFIEPAIKQLKEFKDMESNESITWLIASSGWTYKEKCQFEDCC